MTFLALEVWSKFVGGMSTIFAVLLLSVGLLGLGVLGMCLKVMFHRTRRFAETGAGHQPALRKKGIRCPSEEDAAIFGLSDCSSCQAKLKVAKMLSKQD